VLAARIYGYLSLAHERTGSLASIRSALLGLHRTAVLRHDDVGAETLLNLLLRNYLADNLYDQVGAVWCVVCGV
jgi:26S proteasome regulatory subunit N3